MAKKKKDEIRDGYKRLKDEIIIDRANEILRTQPKNFIAALEETGFKYHEEEDYEEIEEENAKPENQNQKDLIAYFKGEKKLSENILQIFLAEKCAERPNYPLIRKYFKDANQNLKALIIYGLVHFPARLDLLSDLAFFHEFENMLSTLITYYTRACLNEENLQTFSELAQDFYYATQPDEYEALYALRELFEPHMDKRKIIDFLIAEEEEPEKAIHPIES